MVRLATGPQLTSDSAQQGTRSAFTAPGNVTPRPHPKSRWAGEGGRRKDAALLEGPPAAGLLGSPAVL